MRQNIQHTLLDAVVANTTGASKTVELYNIFTFQIIAANVTTGATVSIQATLDGTTWKEFESFAITGNGSDFLTIAQEKLKQVRAVVSNRVDGTYTVLLFAGE
jgi:hypothetical protein